MPTKADTENDETTPRKRAAKPAASVPEEQPTETPEVVEEPVVEEQPEPSEPDIPVAALVANSVAYTGYPSHVLVGGLRSQGIDPKQGPPIAREAAVAACEAFLSHVEQKPKE